MQLSARSVWRTAGEAVSKGMTQLRNADLRCGIMAPGMENISLEIACTLSHAVSSSKVRVSVVQR